MALATTAAVAGIGTAAAYLDAKFHLKKDIKALYRLKRSEREFARVAAEGRINGWYIFEATAKKLADSTCIWSREGVYTWKQVHDMACQYGHYYLSLGVKPGDLVTFYLQNCPEFAIAWLGLWSIGCAPAFINYNLAGNALLHCLKVSGARVLLVDTDPETAARVNDQRAVIENDLGMLPISLDESLKAYIATFPDTAPEDSLRRNVPGSFPSCLFYTSGTTGLPKACSYTMERLYHTVMQRSLGEKLGDGGDRWYNCMPLYHGTGGMSMQTSIMYGVSVAIGKKFSVRNFWKDVCDSKSTFFIYVGETARYLLAAPPSPLERSHNIRCAYGNGMRPDVWERFRERFGIADIAEFFNSSEGMFALLNYNSGPYQSSCVGHHGIVLRRALRDVYVAVENDPVTGDIQRDLVTGFATKKPLSEGGEILVAIPSESAFQGYWNNPEGTAKKFAHDVFKKGDIYYRTGDALRRTDDGHWHFLDRLGDTFRWKSENVSTAEVAVVIGKYPGVLEANVYGVQIPSHEGRAGCVALLIDPARRQSFNFAALARYVRERLPKYAVPVFIRLVEASDHIHNNKQNKVPLREEGVDPAKVGTKVPSGNSDGFLWLLPQTDSYVSFGRDEWDALVRGNVRL
ncbi:hypothetical protein AJ80_07473 [Polytolypa hystricis UAMH7299]|uniref:Very long-chain fatty acid transport protein n=1 Tax=Polytolypa hystricis (strain UAMH7299) TaxID=1447883 RepID=A0A2B7XNM8_POLH7|nr:hypothetical protein AJ80_07473 [Polytolypa hystricis UAMH7299]